VRYKVEIEDGYRIDLLVNKELILELKSVDFVSTGAPRTDAHVFEDD